MSMSRLRIAVIGARGLPGEYGGIERVAENLYPRLVERGHQVTVYCRNGAHAPGPHYFRGVRRIELPVLHSRAADTLSHAVLSMAHVLWQGGYDLIQLEALAPGLLSGTGRLRNLPTAVRVHGLDWQRAKWGPLAARVLHAGEVQAVRRADEIIVVSRELQRYFAQMYQRDVVYIPNGVAGVEHGHPVTFSVLREFGLEPGRYFVFVGRLVPEKRVEDVIRAFAQLPSSHQLAIVGASSYTDGYVGRLRALAAADPRVIFTGFQSGASLDTLMCAAAAFVSSSELEGLPMALLECLDRGVPAILSDIAPHRELIDNVPGYRLFHEVADVAAIADRLQYVLDNGDACRRTAELARARVRRVFAWPAIVERTEETLVAVVEQFRQKRSRKAPVSVATGPSAL